MNLFYLSLIALVVCAHGSKQKTHFTLFQWDLLLFGDPRNYDRQIKAYGATPADVQPHFHGPNGTRVFLTVPKVESNLPYTLVQVADTSDKKKFVKPYPNFEFHKKRRRGDCDIITSAIRMEITECNQMWVIDSGVIASDSVCPPQLLLFDLQTDKLIHRYRFNESLYEAGESLFFTLSVNVKDPKDNCRNTMVYVADGISHDLVVYDYKQKDAWRIKNSFTHPETNYEKQYASGQRRNLWDIMFGMAIDKQKLYFNALATKTEYAVSLSEIDNKNINRGTINHAQQLGELSGVCAATAIDSKSNLYCVTINPIKLIVWNVNTPLDRKHIGTLPIQPEELEFVSGMKVVKNIVGREEIWMLSNKYQKFGIRYNSDINYRVVILPLAKVSPAYPN